MTEQQERTAKPIHAGLKLRVDFDDGSYDTVEFDHLDLRVFGAGLTVQMVEDIQTDGRVVRAGERHADKMPGLVLAIRAALVPDERGALWTQTRTEPGKDPVTTVEGLGGPEGR